MDRKKSGENVFKHLRGKANRWKFTEGIVQQVIAHINEFHEKKPLQQRKIKERMFECGFEHTQAICSISEAISRHFR